MAQFKTRWWNDRWFFKNETAQKNSSWKLLCRKGVYPFDYMSDFKKFGETQLPSKEAQWFRYLWRGQRSREEGLKRIWDENDGRLSQSVSSFSLLPLKKIRKCLPGELWSRSHLVLHSSRFGLGRRSKRFSIGGKPLVEAWIVDLRWIVDQCCCWSKRDWAEASEWFQIDTKRQIINT